MTHMTPTEFLARVVEVAKDCGYPVDDQHPEDMASNLAPVMQAYAAGYGDAVYRMRNGAR